MDCRAFRKRHLAFVDDTLPGVDVARMQDHLSECRDCAVWDSRVRRSLLVARNHLKPIAPSDDFSARLAHRLEQERRRDNVPVLSTGGPRWNTAAAVILSVSVVGAASLAIVVAGEGAGTARLPVVVLEANAANTMTVSPLSSATPAFVATVSTGMAILPALLFAEEVPTIPAASDGSGVAIRPAGYSLNPEQR
jgi:predicted anti-sigma-YlaC factor YlaD